MPRQAKAKPTAPLDPNQFIIYAGAPLETYKPDIARLEAARLLIPGGSGRSPAGALIHGVIDPRVGDNGGAHGTHNRLAVCTACNFAAGSERTENAKHRRAYVRMKRRLLPDTHASISDFLSRAEHLHPDLR